MHWLRNLAFWSIFSALHRMAVQPMPVLIQVPRVAQLTRHSKHFAPSADRLQLPKILKHTRTMPIALKQPQASKKAH